jgi:spermidine synthase
MPLMAANLLFQSPPKRCLLLGLGGGDLVRYLHHSIPNCKITAVELDEKMVQVGQDYFALPNASNIQLIIEDAAHFIAANKRPVDTLLVDLYGHAGLPTLMQEDKFYHDGYRALARDGIMMVNLLINHPQELHTILRKIRQQFHHLTLCLTVAGYKNVIVIAFRQPPATLDRAGLMQRAAEISPQFELDFKGMVENLFTTNPLAGGELFF